MDFLGPYRTTNTNGAKYFITIVDDFIRKTWTQLLHNQTQVHAAIEQFLSMVETHFNTKVTMIRTYSGTKTYFIYLSQSICYKRYQTSNINGKKNHNRMVL